MGKQRILLRLAVLLFATGLLFGMQVLVVGASDATASAALSEEIASESRARVIDAESIFSGITDGAYYNHPVTVTVNEAYADTFTVNGTATRLDANNRFVLDGADGAYTLAAADAAGNSTAVTVTLDKTAPAIKSSSKLKEGGVYCLTLTGTFDEANMDRILVNGTKMALGSNGNGFTMTSGSMNKPIFGALEIVVYDKAGNTLTVHVTLNAEHTYAETERVEPTCLVRGHIRSRCTVCEIATKYEDLGYGAHAYGEPVFTWSDDGKRATATFTCATDNSHTQTVDATVTDTVKTPATCTEDGVTTYTATVMLDGEEFTATKEVADIPAVGHTYGAPAFTWSDDGKRATATFTCATDNSHTQTVEATVTDTVKTPATCTEVGVTTYTATVTFDGKTYTATKDITDIAALGHTYKEGKCVNCGQADPRYVADIPKTGAEVGALWQTLLLVLVGIGSMRTAMQARRRKAF